jgi:hypothetical protein
MVADVKRPEITAREEATTEIAGIGEGASMVKGYREKGQRGKEREGEKRYGAEKEKETLPFPLQKIGGGGQRNCLLIEC